MTTGSLLLVLALLLLVALYIFRPLLLPAMQRRQPSQSQQLAQQKEALLAQIKTLDLDYQTQMLPEDAYRVERAKLMAQAADVLRQLDQLDSQQQEDIDAQIERAVQQLREQLMHASDGDEPQCPQCERPVQAEDQFCRSCGYKLEAVNE